MTEPEASFDFAFDFDCSYPSVEYAMTQDATNGSAAQTTDYFYESINGKFRHTPMAQKNGIIRAYTYCVHGDWRYYYNPLDPEEYLFAIRMNAGGGTTFNATEIDYIELRIDDAAADRYASTADEAAFVMIRDWFVQTKNGDPLTADVDIRFYFPPNEFAQVYNCLLYTSPSPRD